MCSNTTMLMNALVNLSRTPNTKYNYKYNLAWHNLISKIWLQINIQRDYDSLRNLNVISQKYIHVLDFSTALMQFFSPLDVVTLHNKANNFFFFLETSCVNWTYRCLVIIKKLNFHQWKKN